jgi:hypothetical protein
MPGRAARTPSTLVGTVAVAGWKAVAGEADCCRRRCVRAAWLPQAPGAVRGMPETGSVADDVTVMARDGGLRAHGASPADASQGKRALA